MNQELEIWKPIKGYEEKYMVSNLGRVKSLSNNRNRKEKILKPCKDSGGYLFVVLCSNGKCKQITVHRLVSETFIPNPDNLPIINHKDENPLNNCVNNLEWCSVKYNNCYGTRLERFSKSKSKKVACYKDNKLIKVYNAIKDVELDGFNRGNVCSCCRGKKQTHHGFQWRYI